MVWNGEWTYDVMKTYAEMAKTLNRDQKFTENGSCIIRICGTRFLWTC